MRDDRCETVPRAVHESQGSKDVWATCTAGCPARECAAKEEGTRKLAEVRGIRYCTRCCEVTSALS